MIEYDFVAVGPGVNQRWRRRIPIDQVVRLGRSPKGGWAVPWDMRVSREHADLLLEGDRLRIRRLSAARNAIYLHGEALTDFTIGPGEDFRIGRTVFRVDVALPPEGRSPDQSENSQPSESLRDLAVQPAEERLKFLLSRIDEEESASPDRDSDHPEERGVDEDGAIQEAPPRNDIQALRDEVDALKVILEKQHAEASEPEQPLAPEIRHDAPVTAEDHILEDAEVPPFEPEQEPAPEPEQIPDAPEQGEDSVPVAELLSPGSELESELGLLAESSIPPAAVPLQVVDGTAFGN